MIGVGFTLQPDAEFLELTAPLLAAADYYEVAPETLWRPTPRGLEANGFHRRFAALGAASGKRFVAHGVGLALGSAAPDAARRRRWLERIAADHAVFDFAWYSDHLGASALGGQAVTLPLPVPLTPAYAAATRRHLRQLQRVVPLAAVENSVFYFSLGDRGDSLGEPAFLAAATRAPGLGLVLDLHNVYTSALNLGFDAGDYLARLPLERVIELHLSGGSDSDPAWLRSRRRLRLDAHDSAVPAAVWRLCESVLPRCPQLRGVTLERMEGSLGAADVPVLGEELRRLRRLVSA